MTQEEAAKQFKVSLKALRNLEQGYAGVTLTTAAKIFEYLGKQLRVGDIVTTPGTHYCEMVRDPVAKARN